MEKIILYDRYYEKELVDGNKLEERIRLAKKERKELRYLIVHSLGNNYGDAEYIHKINSMRKEGFLFHYLILNGKRRAGMYQEKLEGALQTIVAPHKTIKTDDSNDWGITDEQVLSLCLVGNPMYKTKNMEYFYSNAMKKTYITFCLAFMEALGCEIDAIIGYDKLGSVRFSNKNPGFDVYEATRKLFDIDKYIKRNK